MPMILRFGLRTPPRTVPARRRASLRRLSTLLVIAALLPSAAAGGEYRVEGATIRLIAEPPDEAGRFRGAVLFDLDPGWKTYWLDPGESGIAPRLDFSTSEGVSAPRLAFPAPERLLAEGETLNGYDEPMAVAFEAIARTDGRLALSLFAGVCRTLCVPVAATLRRDLYEPLTPADAAAIDRAFLRLPDNEGSVPGRIEGETLTVQIPSGWRDADDLFVAGPDGWRFGEPLQSEGPVRHVPIRERPRDGAAPTDALQAVIVRARRAAVLTIDLP